MDSVAFTHVIDCRISIYMRWEMYLKVDIPIQKALYGRILFKSNHIHKLHKWLP